MTTTSPADPAGPAPPDGVHDPATVGDAGGGEPAGAAPAVASEAAAESPKTLVIPAEKQRWRKPLRNDIDPDVYAAFVYLRGLIAGDGRPHREIAVAMDLGPAEFAKRFSLSRQNFPPWSGIAPVFRVLDRDPGPFLARWGWLWEAPWSTAQLGRV